MKKYIWIVLTVTVLISSTYLLSPKPNNSYKPKKVKYELDIDAQFKQVQSIGGELYAVDIDNTVYKIEPFGRSYDTLYQSERNTVIGSSNNKLQICEYRNQTITSEDQFATEIIIKDQNLKSIHSNQLFETVYIAECEEDLTLSNLPFLKEAWYKYNPKDSKLKVIEKPDIVQNETRGDRYNAYIDIFRNIQIELEDF